MLSRASLLTQSFSLLPEHLYIWLCGTSPIEFQLIPRGRAYYLAAYSYKCFINYFKIQNHRPSLWKGISFQIVTSEELQNLKVGCSTNSVVDVIRPIFLACTANSLTNLTKSAIPRLFLETFIFTSSKSFVEKVNRNHIILSKKRLHSCNIIFFWSLSEIQRLYLSEFKFYFRSCECDTLIPISRILYKLFIKLMHVVTETSQESDLHSFAKAPISQPLNIPLLHNFHSQRSYLSTSCHVTESILEWNSDISFLIGKVS